MNYRMSCLVAAVALAAGEFAFAGPSCDANTESPLACFQRIQIEMENAPRVAKDAANTTAKAATSKKLADAKVSADTGGAATASTLTDLAPLFDALGILSPGDSNGSQVALNLNFLLPIQDVENKNTQLQLILNTQPVPLEQLVDAFGESIRATRKSELQKSIPTFGDEELKLSWSLVNTRFGRDYRTLRGVLAPMFDGAAAHARSTDAARERLIKVAAFNNKMAELNIDLSTAQSKPIKDFPDGVRAQVEAAAVSAGIARAEWLQLFGSEIARSQLDRLTDLVDQQPQLLFSVSHNFRDEIVGPEQTSATITWEMTSRNLGSFIHGSGESCRAKEVVDGGAAYSACVSALENYLAQDFKDQWRFKLAASYKRVDAIKYSFPADNVALNLPKTDRVEVTIGAGREFSDRPNLGRLDFALSYDSNIHNDTTNKNRLQAAITLTQRIGETDVPFSIVYANKSEFLGDVDHQISLHVGIKFREAGK